MPSDKSGRLRLVIFLITILFVAAGTLAMIRYAKGYRPTLQGQIKGTGLLSANSYPTAAEVYVDGRLTTATDNTLNLEPGHYDVEIRKDGYHPWRKVLQVEQELVTTTSALLFPTSPALEPITFTGVENPIPSPDGSKIVYSVASASAEAKNGLYIQDLNSSPISLGRTSRQLARTSTNYDYSTAAYTWAPSGSEILVAFTGGSHVLLETTRFNDISTLRDVTVTLPQLLSTWEEELAILERSRLQELPDFFTHTATSSALNYYFSPDGEKLLYQAATTLNLPQGLVPPLPASSTQAENRELEPGNWYVYDLVEDKNFLITAGTVASDSASVSKLKLFADSSSPFTTFESSPSAYRRLQTGTNSLGSLRRFNAQYSPIYVGAAQWYPDSSHLVVTSEDRIDIVEYDGTNRTTVYAGPFDHRFVYAAPDGSKLVTRIQFSPDALPNLYTIKLK